MSLKSEAEKSVKEIQRRIRKKYSAEEYIRISVEGRREPLRIIYPS